MNELVTELSTTVQSNGGSMEWSALINSVPYEKRQRVPDALKIAKKQGVLRRQLSRDENGVLVHNVIYIGS